MQFRDESPPELGGVPLRSKKGAVCTKTISTAKLHLQPSICPSSLIGTHHRSDSGHDLCLSGSCSDKDRLLRLERIRYTDCRVAIASSSSPASAGEDAGLDFFLDPPGVSETCRRSLAIEDRRQDLNAEYSKPVPEIGKSSFGKPKFCRDSMSCSCATINNW